MTRFGYTQFHVKQALYGLHQFALSLKSSLEVVVLAAGGGDGCGGLRAGNFNRCFFVLQSPCAGLLRSY